MFPFIYRQVGQARPGGRVLSAALVAVWLGALLAWPLSTPALAAPTGAEVLLAMRRAERQVSLRGTLVMQRTGAPTIQARLWKRGEKRRLEFVAPQIMRGDLLLDDGTYIWRYHRSENAAVQTRRMPANSLDLGWKQLQSRYNAKLTGTTTTAGRKAWTVTLSPRSGGAVARKFWIDQATKVSLRVEHFSNSRRTESMALQSVAFEAVPEAKFKWSTPGGAKLTRAAGTMFARAAPAQKAAPWLKLPASIPEGYAFESAIVDNSKREAWLRYTNGLNRFSVFQQRAGDNKSSKLRRVNGAWFWQTGGFRFLVVGLTEAQARKVAG